MKKTFLTLGVLAFIANFAIGQPEKVATEAQEPTTDNKAVTIDNMDAPDIVFETEAIDYGTIANGSDGQREFKFWNKGKTPLIVSNARGSCGCTVPEWPKEPILPGQSNVIKVKYDTKRPGQFTKTVTLTSNAKTPTKTLTIKGNVLPDPNAQQQAQPVQGKASVPSVTPVKKTTEGAPVEKAN